MMLGGLEILAICSILGGVLGIFFRDKRRAKWLGFILGAIGAVITSFILAQFVFQSLFAIPLYAALGSWLLNTLFKRVAK
jgi:uncharacterized membrane protein HdeD (DUF308 family)